MIRVIPYSDRNISRSLTTAVGLLSEVETWVVKLISDWPSMARKERLGNTMETNKNENWDKLKTTELGHFLGRKKARLLDALVHGLSRRGENNTSGKSTRGMSGQRYHYDPEWC